MNKCVLICDDDEGIIDVTRIILKEKGYRVESLTNCEHIFEKVTKVKPDIILMDLWMPQISGEDVTKKLKANPATKDIPIIIVSANKDTMKIAQTVGANDYLCKPFDITDLEKTVEKYVK